MQISNVDSRFFFFFFFCFLRLSTELFVPIIGGGQLCRIERGNGKCGGQEEEVFICYYKCTKSKGFHLLLVSLFFFFTHEHHSCIVVK